MKKLSCDIYVHPLTVIYIAIALFTGRFSFLFIHLFVAFIHEICHLMTSLILKIPVHSLEMLPFGFYARIDDLEEAPFWKQILILLAGPLSIIISLPIIWGLYQGDIISFYGYRHGYEACFLVFFFNLLPVYPLDGGRLLRAICHRFLDIEHGKILSSVISLLTSAFVCYLCIRNGQLLVMLFIVGAQFKMIIAEWMKYPQWLMIRLIKGKPSRVKISSSPRLYRYYDNYFWKDGVIHGEDEVIKWKLKRWQKADDFLFKNKRKRISKGKHSASEIKSLSNS